MKKKLPRLKNDEDAARFVAEADLSTFDLSGMRRARFEFAAKDARINMRVPERLLEAVKAEAEERGMPYQRFIRETLEMAVARKR